MRFKLFEEFNPYTGAELARKLRIYAEASESTTGVSEISEVGKDFVFDIFTNLPPDSQTTGTKTYRVKIPYSQIEKARVITMEGPKGDQKVTFNTSIEINGENDLEVILLNFLEATNLYDDNVIQDIVDAAENIENVEDIKKIVATLTPDKNTNNS